MDPIDFTPSVSNILTFSKTLFSRADKTSPKLSKSSGGQKVL